MQDTRTTHDGLFQVCSYCSMYILLIYGSQFVAYCMQSVLEAHGFHSFYVLPFGSVVATCTLIDCMQITPDNVPAAPEFHFGDYTVGRWAWYLTEIKALFRPIPAKGNLGLWEWANGRIVSTAE